MKVHYRHHRIQKRSYLLLEVLISLSLVLVCLFPLLKPLHQLRSIEKKKLALLQHSYRAHQEFASLKMALFENKMSWKELMKENTSRLVTEIDHANKKSKKETYYLLTVYFKDHDCTFPLLITKKSL